jgi:DNA polymerase-1
MMNVSRDGVKPLNHGNNYGLGAKAMITKGHDPELVSRFFEVMSRFEVKAAWTERVREQAESGQLLDNGFGRKMRCDPARAYTQAPALMGQGCARDIMTTGLLRMVDRLPEITSMLRCVVHDEVVLSVPVDRVDEVTEVIKDAMTFEFRGVPILADVSAPGTDWSLCYGSK